MTTPSVFFMERKLRVTVRNIVHECVRLRRFAMFRVILVRQEILLVPWVRGTSSAVAVPFSELMGWQ